MRRKAIQITGSPGIRGLSRTSGWTSVRRAIVAASVLFCACAVHAGETAAQQKLERLAVRTAFLPSGWDAAYFLAKEKGWYADRGLEVNIDDGVGSAITVQMVGAGNYDIGIANQTVMAISRAKGTSLKSVAGIIQKTDLGVIVPIGAGINTPKDLEGKTCLYSAGSLDSPFIPTFFKQGGADASKVKMLAVGAGVKVSMYSAGAGDCLFAAPPPFIPQLKDTRPSQVIWFSDYGIIAPSLGIIVSEETLKNRREAVRAFVEVSVRSWDYVLQGGHVQEAAEAVVRQRPQSKLNLAIVISDLEAYRPLFGTDNTKGKPFGWQSETDWANTVRSLEEVGLIKAGTKPSDYYTNELIPNK